MAKHISPSDHPVIRTKAKMPKPAQGNDLDTLFPERDIEVAGETITMRELTFGEQLKHGQALATLAEALRPVLLAPAASGTEPDPLTLILDVLARHNDIAIKLAALCCDRPREWLENLSGREGEDVLILWWGVNSPFFLRRLIVRPGQIKAEIARQKLNQLAGGKSSPPSFATDTSEAS
ncbi:MAG: hypothetical protein LBU53_07660 [Zoogloeaceae bacterium]|nr:hypothetical protein [Zoogloeaceae bacterium]